MIETNTSTARFLLEHDNFLFGIHVNPDGDCFGSACGLCTALQNLGKKCAILSPNIIPKRLEFLNYSGVKVVTNFDDLAEFKPKTFMTIDVASVHLLADIDDNFKSNIAFAIDHHNNNTLDTKQIYLDSTASATGEIIYDVICELEEWTNNSLWDKNTASSVFGAISSDTGCFKYSNVTPKTHLIASKLLEQGIDSADINFRLFDLKTPIQIAVESLAYDSIEYFEYGKISFIYFSNDMLKSIGARVSDTETVSQIGRGIEGVQIAVYMREKGENEYKISVRSNNNADMSALCASFGIGGGHMKAAGCTIFTDSAEKAKQMFLDKAKEYVE